MTPRCLIVSDAAPSRTGAAGWRRLRMFAEFYRGLGYDLQFLSLSEERPSLVAVQEARAQIGAPAFAKPEDAGRVVERMDARWAFDLFHFAAAGAPAWLGAGRTGVRVTDGLSALHARGRLGARRVHSDIILAADAAEQNLAGAAGVEALRVYHLGDARRSTLKRIGGDDVRAGVWVENDDNAVAASEKLLDALRTRGGGAPPSFLVGGPGAARVTAPRLARPVTILDADLSERAFYRGVDVALFSESEGEVDLRYGLFTAMELGATPLASSAVLRGEFANWRLPHFADLDAFAEYLFERGRDLRDGGLLAELRARADWTWSGLQRAAAAERRTLIDALRAKTKETAHA